MTERRYSEAEVAAIFELATKAQVGGRKQLAASDGMTLAGLQEIGREVGVSPELVAEAARSLDRVGAESTRRFLGLPIGVGRTVDLGRKLSDTEWEQLVVHVREKFDATGAVKVEGAFREWHNGNLQVLVEPTPSGNQVRMKTVHSGSLAALGFGAMFLTMASVVAATLAVAGRLPQKLPAVIMFALFGAASLAWGTFILPGWAKLRRRQMEELANKLTSSTE
jgi:hypothetical protein